MFSPVPRSLRARRDRHERRVRDAMDAGCTARRAAQSRTVKPCGPDPPTLESSLADDDRQGDGG